MRKRDQTPIPMNDDLLDMTPLINVTLILLIVFLCLSPMTLMTGIKAVNSGKSDGSASDVSFGKTTKDDLVLVFIDKDGNLFINSNPIERRLFVAYLRDAILFSPKKEVLISSADNNRVEEVVNLLDLAKQNGAKKVILAE